MDSFCRVNQQYFGNYETLEKTWEEALQVTQDTETIARILGVAAQMKIFTYFYGSMLGELVFKHIDNLSQTLQYGTISAVECQQIASMTVTTLNSMRID